MKTRLILPQPTGPDSNMPLFGVDVEFGAIVVVFDKVDAELEQYELIFFINFEVFTE